jgi:diaminohydroxyphosphoribosylaminopyrimidine deaminase/5-amino-6-(5-phosphoribosylamino)uracil reductase
VRGRRQDSEDPVSDGHVMNRCRQINECTQQYSTSFVFLKLYERDGRIATTGHSRWITCEASRRKVHRLRDRVSAIMVGIGTVIDDDPALTTRLPKGRGRDPIRVVVDSSLRTPPAAAIFNPASAAGVIIATRKDPPSEHKSNLEEQGLKFWEQRV